MNKGLGHGKIILDSLSVVISKMSSLYGVTFQILVSQFLELVVMGPFMWVLAGRKNPG